MPRSLLLPFFLTAGCFVYALVRYVGFRGDSPEQIPLYVCNKALALSGVIFLAWSRCHPRREKRRSMGWTALALLGLHVLLSMMVLHPAYFPNLYHSGGLMTWQAEASLSTGAIAAMLLGWSYTLSLSGHSTPGRNLRPFLGRVLLFTTLLHVGFMGYAGWLEPETWPGSLPPITLLSAVVALAALCWPRATRPEGSEQPAESAA